MIERITENLYKNWKVFFPARPVPSHVRYLLSRGSYGKHAKATFLLFADDHLQPFCVVKIPLFEEGCEFLRNEYEVLYRLHALNQSLERLNVPRCWLIEGIGETVFLLQEAVGGNPFRQSVRRRDYRGLLHLGVDWITQLHLATQVDLPFSKEDYVKFVSGPVQNALEQERHRSKKVLLEQMASRLEQLIDQRIPWVLCHNDFRISNIRRDGERLGVVDWEFSQWPGLPVMDVLNFIVDYHAEENLTDFAASFEDVFKKAHGRYAKEVGSLLEQYCKNLGLNQALIPVWIDLYLVQKLHLAQRILFPLQIFDGIGWAKDLDRVITFRTG